MGRHSEHDRYGQRGDNHRHEDRGGHHRDGGHGHHRCDGDHRDHDHDHHHRHHDHGGSVETTTVSFTSGLSAMLVAGADAVGSETLASIYADLTVVDRGLFSYAVGTIDAFAAAQSPDGSSFATTYATAETVGADLTVISSSTVAAQDADTAVAGTTLDMLALDCKWLDLDMMVDDQQDGPAPAVSLSGNLAEFAVDVTAVGDNSLTDVYGDALAFEDSFSTTTISANAVVSSTVTYEMTTGTGRADTIVSLAGNALVQAGSGRDTIVTAFGDDWIFAGRGADHVMTGAGNDTVFAGDSADSVLGGDGEDWLFGQGGNDNLHGNDGDDLILGGRGHDHLEGGNGNDLIDGGDGHDRAFGGGGGDVFRLGAAGGDGNDDYWGGSGADLYALMDDFGRDSIWDFRLAEGDRLSFSFDSADLTLERLSRSGHDLELRFDADCGSAQLTLEDFFTLNADCYALPHGNHLDNALVQQLLADLVAGDGLSQSDATLFDIAGYLAELG